MTDVRSVQQQRVVVCFEGEEAGKLRTILGYVDFDAEPWARELYDTLETLGVDEQEVEFIELPNAGDFEEDED